MPHKCIYPVHPPCIVVHWIVVINSDLVSSIDIIEVRFFPQCPLMTPDRITSNQAFVAG